MSQKLADRKRQGCRWPRGALCRNQRSPPVSADTGNGSVCPTHRAPDTQSPAREGLAGPGSRPSAQLSPILHTGCSLHLVKAGGGGGPPERPRIHLWLSLAVTGGAWGPWKWPVTCSWFGDFSSALCPQSVALSELWKGSACHDGVRPRYTAGAVAPDRDPGSPSTHGPGARRPAWGLAQSNGLYSPGAGDEHPRLLLLRGSRLAPLWPTLVPEPGVPCDERAGIGRRVASPLRADIPEGPGRLLPSGQGEGAGSP